MGAPQQQPQGEVERAPGSPGRVAAIRSASSGLVKSCPGGSAAGWQFPWKPPVPGDRRGLNYGSGNRPGRTRRGARQISTAPVGEPAMGGLACSLTQVFPARAQ